MRIVRLCDDMRMLIAKASLPGGLAYGFAFKRTLRLKPEVFVCNKTSRLDAAMLIITVLERPFPVGGVQVIDQK